MDNQLSVIFIYAHFLLHMCVCVRACGQCGHVCVHFILIKPNISDYQSIVACTVRNDKYVHTSIMQLMHYTWLTPFVDFASLIQ